jgi:hypothetical protein
VTEARRSLLRALEGDIQGNPSLRHFYS